MGLFDAIDIAASGLTAERLRMDVTAENLANAQSTRGAGGGPYRRKVGVLQEAAGFGAARKGAMGVGSGGQAGGVNGAGISHGPAPNRRRRDVTAENRASARSTGGGGGGPSRGKAVVLQEAAGCGAALKGAMGVGSGGQAGGVNVAGTSQDPAPNRRVYDPGHPDAD